LGQSVTPKTIKAYKDEDGNEPFTAWFRNLKDTHAKARIEVRLRRLESGLYGDCEPVGEGVSELRMFFGPGYRVYFGEEAGNIIILLCGGDKDSQKQDIKKAKEYWKEYQDHGKT
jgi:putative addiction module killer protein